MITKRFLNKAKVKYIKTVKNLNQKVKKKCGSYGFIFLFS